MATPEKPSKEVLMAQAEQVEARHAEYVARWKNRPAFKEALHSHNDHRLQASRELKRA